MFVFCGLLAISNISIFKLLLIYIKFIVAILECILCYKISHGNSNDFHSILKFVGTKKTCLMALLLFVQLTISYVFILIVNN